MSNYHYVEAVYLHHIRTLKKEQSALEERDLSADYDLSSYLKRQELKNYVNNYRFTLSKLRGCAVKER